jgi:hypothetical protein
MVKKAKVAKVRKGGAKKKAAVGGRKPAAKPASTAARNLVTESLAADTNRVIFDHIIGTHWPDERKLDPPFDKFALAGLAANIKAHNVPVQTAQVQLCETVKCVLDLMRAANPGGG